MKSLFSSLCVYFQYLFQYTFLCKVLLGLRAIGNAGHVSSAARLLNKCVNRNRNPMEVRVAAAQAFRRMPCDADVSGAPSFF